MYRRVAVVPDSINLCTTVYQNHYHLCTVASMAGPIQRDPTVLIRGVDVDAPSHERKDCLDFTSHSHFNHVV
jgi:hypothetical protein